MVFLNNIKRSSAGIECDYNPEKSGKIGHIFLKIDETSDIQYSKYEYGKQTYAQKATQKLESILRSSGEIPKSAAVIWY